MKYGYSLIMGKQQVKTGKPIVNLKGALDSAMTFLGMKGNTTKTIGIVRSKDSVLVMKVSLKKGSPQIEKL